MCVNNDNHGHVRKAGCVCECVYLYITGVRTHSQMRSPHDIKPVVLTRSQHASKGEKLKVEGFTGKHAKDPRP